MKSSALKILMVTISLFAFGLGGAYLVVKEGKRQVMGYSLQLAKKILAESSQSGKDDADKSIIIERYRSEINEIDIAFVSDELSLEEITNSLNELFAEKSFISALISKLEEIDKKNSPPFFRSWDRLKVDLETENSKMIFQTLWGTMIKVHVNDMEQQKDSREISPEYFKALNLIYQ